MTRSEKKAVIESMAEKFMNIDDLEGKSMTIMVMSAYAEGKDLTGLKVRDRFDVQPVDKAAVIKGQITEVING